MNSKKAAQLRQVEVMKMRHQAQPADPKDKNRQIPMTDRLHVKVRLKDNEKQHVYWFQKVRWLLGWSTHTHLGGRRWVRARP